MTRQEAYAKIKELNLQDLVKQMTGKNFTQVSTMDLEKLIAANEKTIKTPKTPNPTPEAVITPKEEKKEKAQDTITVSNIYEAACLVFLGVLKENGVLPELLAKL